VRCSKAWCRGTEDAKRAPQTACDNDEWGEHAIGCGEQRQENGRRNNSRVCSQRAVAHLREGENERQLLSNTSRLINGARP
jgi:hypothetical protein